MLEAGGVGGRNPSIFLPGSQQIASEDWPLLGTGLANAGTVVQARPGHPGWGWCSCPERTNHGKGQQGTGGSIWHAE